MQRVGLITPLSNLTVEEEFQKYVKNTDLICQFFKLDYSTHKSENEKEFYEELASSIRILSGKLSFTEFKKIINMCTSLSIQINDKTFDSATLLKELIKKKKTNDMVFISPYSKEITNKIIEFLEIDPKVQYVELKRSIDYYQFGKESLRNIAKLNSAQILVSCTNIPTLDLICKEKCNIISINQAVIMYLNNLGKKGEKK